MKSEFVREITALKSEVDEWNKKYLNAYNAEISKKLYTMLNKLKEVREKLEVEYNNAPVGSKEEKELFELGGLVASYHKYFLDRYNSMQKLKPAYPAMNTGAVYGTASSAVSEPKEKNGHGAIAAMALVTAAAALFIALSTANIKPINTWFNRDDKKVEQIADKEEKEQETVNNNKTEITVINGKTLPKYDDASNAKQVEARAKWYYDAYFSKLFSGLSDTAKETANEKTLANNMPVLSGGEKLYTDFNYGTDIIEANNAIVQQFCSNLSLDNKTGKVDFVPSQYLYLDGSYEQECAAEVDAVLELLVNAIKNKNDEAFKKYATEFGIIMAHQYYYLDIKDGYHNVRGMADSPSKIHLWAIAYAEYTNKIMTYALDHGINICVPFCKDYSTGETVEMPLSKLMAMLDFVPMNEWDAVLARAGISVSELEAMGNKDTDNTMPVVFMADAKNHYKGMVPVLR